MNRFLSVVMLSILMVSGAQAYPAGERAGDNADGITACPVVEEAAPHSALQRWGAGAGTLQPQYPMSPVATCGQPPDVLAQVPMGTYCRNGGWWCRMTHPPMRPIGEDCCCVNPVQFCGWVSSW